MDRHLVTVKVCVKCGTYQRMQLNGLAFYKYRFKRLNTKPVHCWRPVQHNRMFADHFFKNIPNFRTFFFDHTLGHLNGAGQ